MERPIIDGLSETVTDYILYLEQTIADFGSSSVLKLIRECEETAGVIADDVKMLRDNADDDGLDDRLQMLGSKQQKNYGKYLALVGNIKHFKLIYDLAQEFKPKITVKTETTEVDLNSSNVNMFEEISKKVKIKNA